ncbi:helicase HerA domain-containing protein [Breznakiellaceae bacterium SP9]
MNEFIRPDTVQSFTFLTNFRDGIPAAQEIEKLSDGRLAPDELVLFKIEEITFEEEAPRQEALENVFASLRHVKGINFIYLILGDARGVNFYFGLSRELNEKSDISVQNMGDSILKSSLEGNFRGSKVHKIEEKEKRCIIEKLAPPSDKKYYAAVNGVPGINNDDSKKNFQGVDRLVDVMLGDEFGFMIIAHPISEEQAILTIEKDLYVIYDTISFAAKQSVQYGSNRGEQKGSSTSTGKQSGTSEGDSDTSGTNSGWNKGTNYAKGSNEGTNYSKGSNEGTNYSKGSNEGTNYSKGSNEGTNYAKGTNEGTNYARGTNEGTNRGSSRGNSSSSTNDSRSSGTNESSGRTQGSSETRGKSQGTSETSGKSKGTSETSGKSQGTSETRGESKGTSETRGVSEGTSGGESKSTSHNVSRNSGISESYAVNEGEQSGTSTTVSIDFTHKDMQEWLKYFDEVILPRLDYGHGKGIFVTSSLFWANNEKVLKKLLNTATALFAGEKGNRVPLTVSYFPRGTAYLNALRLFQQPLSAECLENYTDEWKRKIVWSHSYLSKGEDAQKRFYLGNWMSVKELAVMAGIPQKEVVGLRLKEEVEFGLNVPDLEKEEIELGKLVVGGNAKDIPVKIRSADLDRHIFVSGVTGAGKTTTCQNLLIDSGLPFLIIEPAKTEYRILLDKFPDMEIFTLGSNTAPLRLNPFQFFEGESITSRVDMIKASINAAFDMEAAIPQIIEQTIYDSYGEKGWNIAGNSNTRFENPYAPGTDSFPTMSGILKNVEKAVDKQGFDIRLRNDYIGSIKARLQGLTLGAKGLMLDCTRSVDFDRLLDMRVVLELEELRDGGEKSLVIGFVMMNLLEAIRRRFERNRGEKHRHITLIEEAHRLLSKPQPGDANKQHGIDTFTDMLAEIRKYGESLIIADQIPNKLTPEVLKNTNIKIVHRLFAQDDKDAIGNTMALTEEQRSFLSNLDIGRAIVFNGNWSKAVQVQIKKSTDTSKEAEQKTDKDSLKKRNLEFYCRQWEQGIIEGSRLFGRQPSREEIELLMHLGGNLRYKNALLELKERKNKELLKPLEDLFAAVSDKEGLAALLAKYYLEDSDLGEYILNAIDAYNRDGSCPNELLNRFKYLKRL